MKSFNGNQKSQMSVSSVFTYGSLAFVFLIAACGPITDSLFQQRLGSAKDTNLVTKALEKKFAIRINLKTNRLSYLNDGVVIAQWNVASGDVSGKYHRGVPQTTPPGVYTVHEMTYCPEWLPAKPFDPSTGQDTSTEEARWRVIGNNQRVYGACGGANPLGQYVMWFSGPYGMHGNANESILQLPSSDERRVSGGCVRNPNQKIKWLFHDILTKSGAYPDYRNRVMSMETQTSKSAVTGAVAGLGISVVVDYFDRDPAVGEKISSLSKPISSNNGDSIGQVKPQAPTTTPKVSTKPSDGQGDYKLCRVTYTEKDGVTYVYSKLPAIASNKNRELKMGQEEKVFGADGDFYKLSDGWILKSRLGQCQSSK